VVIVPGNHDINRKLCEAYFAQCEGEEQKPVAPYWLKWKHYHWLFQEFYGKEKGVSFTIEEPWTLWEFEDLKLVVAGLNSTMAESHQEGTYYGWVGEAQLRWFADHLAPFRERGWYRLGVVHHNVERGATDDDEISATRITSSACSRHHSICSSTATPTTARLPGLNRPFPCSRQAAPR
jgi:3',5'-cyclic AMP phosphodiesterase CpdA